MKALNNLRRTINSLEYKKQLLEWLLSKPRKRKGYTLTDIKNAAQIDKAQIGSFKSAVIGLHIVETEDARFRLPRHDIIEEMVIEYNNQQKRKAQIFGDCAPPLLIEINNKTGIKNENE